MANKNGNQPILCPHGILGKKKCRTCRLEWERHWIKQGNNREKGRKATARWAENNREYNRLYARKRAGIPIEHGESPVAECLLCSDVTTLVPDHDHFTGQFRGWICGRCNRALGVYETYKPLLGKFEDYLSSNRETNEHTIADAGERCTSACTESRLGV